jgi:O-antigen/teichoic acid export membrane protein
VVQLTGYVVVTNTCWNVDSILNAFRSGRALLWVRFVQAVSFLAIAVVWGLVEQSVWGLVWATIGSWSLSLVLRVRALSRVMRWRVPRSVLVEGWHALPRLVAFGVRAAPGGILVGINNESGTWILGVTSPVSTVGAWNRARQLGDRLQEGLIRLNEVLLPTLAERRGLGDDEGHDRAWADSVRYGLVALLLIAAAGGGAAEGIMNVFGPGFSAGATALAIILLYQAVHAVDSIHVTALYVANRPFLTTIASGVAMVAGITVSVLGAIWMGVAGPALGLVVSALVGIAVMHGAVRSLLVTPLSQLWPARQMVAIVVAYVAGFAASYAVDRALDGHLWTVAALAAGTTVYLAVFVSLGGVGDRDRNRLSQVRDRLRGRGAPAEV